MTSVAYKWHRLFVGLLMFVFACTSLGQDLQSLEKYKRKTKDIQYLVFMLGREFFKGKKGMQGNIDAAVATLVERVGTKGNGNRKLAFALPLPTWQKVNDKHFEAILNEGAEAAIKRDVAIYFYVETLEWDTRPDLWNYKDPEKPGYNPKNKENVEWMNWKGTPYPNRYRDWGKPEEMAPVMCYNSPRILKEISRIVRERVLPKLKSILKKLKEAGKENLFAGLTVGAEQMLPNYEVVDKINSRLGKLMEQQGAPKVRLGYHALSNKGYSAKNPPEDFADALAEVNQEYVAYWAKQLSKGGIPKSKMYTHIAAAGGCKATAMLRYTNAPNRIAFNKYTRPGWTTYAAGHLSKGFEVLYKMLEKQGNPHWGGTEANPNFGAGVHPETYLSWHFDFGATVVLMNTGATSKKLTDRLNEGVWGKEAVAAYRKFLSGKPLNPYLRKATLKNHKSPNKEVRQRLQGKVKKVQQGIRQWHKKGRDPSRAGHMMKEFEQLVKDGKLKQAEELIDRVIKFLGKIDKDKVRE